MILFSVVYQCLPVLAVTYTLCALAAGYPANRTTWFTGLGLAVAFAAASTMVMRHSLPHSVRTGDLVASYLCLYALPMISMLGIATALERGGLRRSFRLVALLVGSAASLLAAQY